MIRRPPRSTLFPYTTLFRSPRPSSADRPAVQGRFLEMRADDLLHFFPRPRNPAGQDRKSTRLNSSHGYISYAVFCLKKKRVAVDGSKPLPSSSIVKASTESS